MSARAVHRLRSKKTHGAQPVGFGARTDRRRRNGLVLLVVVIVVAMMSLAGFSFVAMLSAENKAVRAHGVDLQMDHLLHSGEALLKLYVTLPPDARQMSGGLYDNRDLFGDVPVVEGVPPQPTCRFSIVSPRVEEGEVRGVRFGAENESARLHLGMVLQWELQQPGAGKMALARLPGMSETILDSLLDWMDPDNETRQYGAESGYYAGRGVPYGPRNAIPASIEELLLVRGVTRDLLFGTDINFNRMLDPQEGANFADRLDTLRSGGESTWWALLTVYSAERNLTPEGYPRVNLNDPDLEALHQMLTAVFDRSVADFAIAYRQYGRATGSPTTPASQVPPPDLRVPPAFQFASVLDLIGGVTKSYLPNSRNMVNINSPLTLDRRAIPQYLPRLLEYCTIQPTNTIAGRVNINLAPRLILSCVPGMDDSLVNRIVAARGGPDQAEAPERRYPTWLLTEGLVDLERMKMLLPYITCGGDVFRAQIVGYYEGAGPAGRAEVVLDATGAYPREVYWKDLRIFGRGYTPEVLGVPSETSSSPNQSPGTALQ